jgi:general secretion pathway protein I
MGDERGFVLLEVLVAFAIAALALAVLYNGGIEGLNGTRLAERTDEAVARARSRLNAACHGAKLVPGTRGGDDGSGYTWQTEIARTESANIVRGSDDDPKPPMSVQLYAVRVSVSWRGTIRPHTVSLATDCIAILPPKP